VKYRDVPGIDTAYLAMDTEEGVEVVWNEAQFSGSKKFQTQVSSCPNLSRFCEELLTRKLQRQKKSCSDPGGVAQWTSGPPHI
jgi:hypothetical protein